MKKKNVCYQVNCPNKTLNRVGVNMLKVLGIQPGTESFEKQKHLIAVNMCREHFLEKFPTFADFKKAYHFGMMMITKDQYIKLSKDLYEIEVGKEKIGEFRASPKS